MSKGRHRRHRNGRGHAEGVRAHAERLARRQRTRATRWFRRRKAELADRESREELRAA